MRLLQHPTGTWLLAPLQPHLLPQRSWTPAIPHRLRLQEPCQACPSLYLLAKTMLMNWHLFADTPSEAERSYCAGSAPRPGARGRWVQTEMHPCRILGAFLNAQSLSLPTHCRARWLQRELSMEGKKKIKINQANNTVKLLARTA